MRGHEQTGLVAREITDADLIEGARRSTLEARAEAILAADRGLVTQPCTSPHHGLTPEERTRHGFSDAMLQLSIGNTPRT